MFFGKQLFALVAASLFTVSSGLGEYPIFTSTNIIFGFFFLERKTTSEKLANHIQKSFKRETQMHFTLLTMVSIKTTVRP
jgi:hypothetical protein